MKLPELNKREVNILMFSVGLLMGFVPGLVWGGLGILLTMLVLKNK